MVITWISESYSPFLFWVDWAFYGLVWTMGFSGPCWARALLKWNETFSYPKTENPNSSPIKSSKTKQKPNLWSKIQMFLLLWGFLSFFFFTNSNNLTLGGVRCVGLWRENIQFIELNHPWSGQWNVWVILFITKTHNITLQQSISHINHSDCADTFFWNLPSFSSVEILNAIDLIM